MSSLDELIARPLLSAAGGRSPEPLLAGYSDFEFRIISAVFPAERSERREPVTTAREYWIPGAPAAPRDDGLAYDLFLVIARLEAPISGDVHEAILLRAAEPLFGSIVPICPPISCRRSRRSICGRPRPVITQPAGKRLHRGGDLGGELLPTTF